MSKPSLAIVAALGVGSGAAIAASLYSLRSSTSPSSSAPSPPTTTSSSPATTTAVLDPDHASSTAVTQGPVDPSGFFRYGFPGPVADVTTRPAVISSYDRRLRNPHWSIEHITPQSLQDRQGNRNKSSFRMDPSIPQLFAVTPKDYTNSGFDRGHHVPAADAAWSQDAMNSTFYMTNISPQVGDGFNRDYWSHFEDFCRRLTSQYPSVRIVTGPLYLPRKEPDGKWYVKYEMIGKTPSIAVPTHFYKVIFAEDGKSNGNVAIGAFVLPNASIPNDTPITNFQVPLEAIERASGLVFADKLPQQRRKKLCDDITCSLRVRQFAKQQKAFEPQPSLPALPSPSS